MMDGLSISPWNNGIFTPLIRELPEELGSHFNDVVADPVGRVFSGTVPNDETSLPNRQGRLYRLDTNGSINPILDGIGISNGFAFSTDGSILYYTDSFTRQIYMFDYDVETGNISNKRTLLETPLDKGVPDGMSVDSNGYVWSARWEGWALYRYAPDGTEGRRVHLPAKKVSSLTFEGSDLTDIYVTTGGCDNKTTEGEGAGALFRVNIGIQGKPEFYSGIGL